MHLFLKLLAAVGIFTLTAQAAPAATEYWDTNGATPGTNASTTAGGGIAQTQFTFDPTGSTSTFLFNSGDALVLSADNGISTSTGLNTLNFGVNTTVNGLTFNHGTFTLTGNGNGTLTLGNGLTVSNTIDGATTLASSMINVLLSTSQNFSDNSSKALNIQTGLLSSAASGVTTLTNNGSGTGTVTFSGVIGNGSSGSTMAVTQNSSTSALALNGGNTYSGGTTVNAGVVDFNNFQSFGIGTIHLNNGAGLTGTAGFTNNGGLSNNIVLGTGGGVINFSGDTFFDSVVTGGTGLTIGTGDVLVSQSAASNVGTLNLVGSGTISPSNRILFFSYPGLFNGATVNLSNGYILDFSEFGPTVDNVINFGTNTAFEARNGINISLTKATLASSGTFLIGADDVASNNNFYLSNTATSTLANLTGNLVISTNSSNNNTEFDSGFTGIGSVEYKIAAGGKIHLDGTGSYSGGTIIDSGTIESDGPSTTLGKDGSNITLAGGAFTFGGSISTFNHNFILSNAAGSIINGAGDDFINGDFNGGNGVTFNGGDIIITGSSLANNNVSSITTSGGRVILFDNLDILNNNATLHVTNGATFSFGSGTGLGNAPGHMSDAAPTNQMTFDSGTALEVRDTNLTVDIANLNLPTAGSITIGGDDVAGGQIFITDNQNLGIALTGNMTYNISTGSQPTPVFFGPAISGAYGITKSGGGTMYLEGFNSYAGGTTINGGTLEILGENGNASPDYNVTNGNLEIAGGSVGHISDSSNIVLGGGTTSGELILGDSMFFGATQTIASLTTSGTGTANAVINGGGAGMGGSALIIDNDVDDTFSGTIGGTGIGQNELSLEKSGQGTLTLSGINTYTGGTTVDSGKLAVNGSVAGNIVVNYGAEVGGHGKIGGTISGQGAVSPGNSPGILTAAAVDSSGGTSFNFEFTLNSAPTYGNAAASGNDVLHLNGSTPFAFALTSSNDVNLYFAQTGSFQGGFFINGSTSSLAANLTNATFTYYLLDNTNGTISYNGNLYDLTSGTASTVAVAGANFTDGTVSGATEQFTISSVPEPSTYALIGLSVLALAWRLRRKTNIARLPL